MPNVKHKFKYVKIGNFYRPLIDITLCNGSQTAKYAVLVDSGADFNVFHSDVASLLGLDISLAKPVEFGGIKDDGKPCIGYLCAIEIGIDGVFFNSFALFSSDISPNGNPVVGQRGFFEHFNSVQFDYPKKLGYLK